jgi:hypothetical protein
MPRFLHPPRYNQDWYIDLKGEYQKFFDYIIETCDNAGVWKPNKIDFETKTGFKINLDSFLERVNKGKERVLVLENGRWLIPGFVRFQSFNKKHSFELKDSHPFHKNIIRSLIENNCQGLIKGLERVCQGVKDKDKDKDIILKENTEDVFPQIIRGEVTYDAERTVLEAAIEFEQICMKTGKSTEQAKSSLRKFHLYQQKQSRYPMGRGAAFAGFELWLMNENKFGGPEPKQEPKKPDRYASFRK